MSENKVVENKEITQEMEKEAEKMGVVTREGGALIAEGSADLENVFTLKKAIEFEGQTYKEIVLNLEDLTGEDIEKAEMMYNAENTNNQVTMVKEMAKPFAAIVAAKAANVPVQVIRKLPASDYSKVTMRVTVFLMAGQ